MNAWLLSFSRMTVAVWAVLLICSPVVFSQTAAVPPVPTEELPAGSEVLSQGPVHEAFAKPVTMDPQAPVLIPQQPPEALQEIPPAEKPAGAEIVWVPGYWAWDENRNDFIWVSGCWRNAPPNTYWVPGHWLGTAGGWQWIAGFWKAIATPAREQIEYLPAPPAAFEIEAPGRPPLPDQVWVPGCWYWANGQYVRRSGYWITPQVGWVWVPSHYVWTPRGYIFSPGHWDYDLDSRGVLFTPAYFPPAVRVRVGFVYSPGVCVDLGMLRLNLFAYPRYRHYYFGDYYDDAYLRMGIYPWFRCQTVHAWYDPLFVYERWHYRRTEPNWARRQAEEYRLRRANHDLRPARTFAGLQVQMQRMAPGKRPERLLVQPMKTFAGSQATPVKFERLTASERQQFAARSSEVRKFRDQRDHWESSSGPSGFSSPPAGRQVPATRNESATVPSKGPVSPQRVGQPTETRRQPKPLAAPQVRVTRPEQVAVPSQAIQARPFESRYIEKQAPDHPVQEHYRSDAGPGRRSPAMDSRGKMQPNIPPGRGRQQ